MKLQTPPDDALTAATTRRRWLVPAVLFVTVIFAFLDRLNIAYVIQPMAIELGWSAAEASRYQGQLIAVFFVSYGLANIFLSPLAGHIGPRRSLMIVVTMFSLFTLLGGVLAGSLAAFGATRVLLGISEGVHYPMMSTLTKRWFPPGERSRASGMWVSGGVIATILAPLVVVPLVAAFGWRAMFVVLGVSGVAVSLPLLWRVIYDRPEAAWWMPPEESAEITSRLEVDSPSLAGWGFLRGEAFYLALAGGMLNNFCVYGILFWLPDYLVKARGIEFSDLSLTAALPYMAGVLGIVVAAYLGDRLNRRALVAAAGFLIAAGAIVGAVQAETLAGAVGMLACGVLANMSYTTQEYAILSRILPHDAVSRGTGLYNGMALLVGAGLGQAIIGEVAAASGNPNAPILVIAVAAVVATLVMLRMAAVLKY